MEFCQQKGNDSIVDTSRDWVTLQSANGNNGKAHFQDMLNDGEPHSVSWPYLGSDVMLRMESSIDERNLVQNYMTTKEKKILCC